MSRISDLTRDFGTDFFDKTSNMAFIRGRNPFPMPKWDKDKKIGETKRFVIIEPPKYARHIKVKNKDGIEEQRSIWEASVKYPNDIENIQDMVFACTSYSLKQFFIELVDGGIYPSLESIAHGNDPELQSMIGTVFQIEAKASATGVGEKQYDISFLTDETEAIRDEILIMVQTNQGVKQAKKEILTGKGNVPQGGVSPEEITR